MPPLPVTTVDNVNKGFAIVSFLLRHGSARPSMREWGKHIKRVSKCSRAHYGGCCGLCNSCGSKQQRTASIVTSAVVQTSCGRILTFALRRLAMTMAAKLFAPFACPAVVWTRRWTPTSAMAVLVHFAMTIASFFVRIFT